MTKRPRAASVAQKPRGHQTPEAIAHDEQHGGRIWLTDVFGE
jgi:hypothetical protein